MSLEENKDLIQRYMSAIDADDAGNWDLLDDYIAQDFVAHHAPAPGVTLDRAGVKQSAEIFRVGAPGSHEIVMQIAEGDLVVSYTRGRGVHAGELFGIPATNKSIETEGIAIHLSSGGKIAEYWSVVDFAGILAQLGLMPAGGG
ncbi:MAG TPA: ester cyclase [Mycobacterium sp.]|nr:ester cyclase [Mycobacterium sp.]